MNVLYMDFKKKILFPKRTLSGVPKKSKKIEIVTTNVGFVTEVFLIEILVLFRASKSRSTLIDISHGLIDL